MQILGPETAVVDPKRILDLSKDKLSAALRKIVDEGVEPEKIVQYRMARRNDFYWRGIFDIAPTRVSDEVVDYTAIGIPVSSDKRRHRELSYNFNIIRGDFMKAIAVIGAKAPECAAVPDEADNEDAIDVARRADLVDQKIATKQDMNAIQAELVLDLSITTTAFIYTPWVVNGERYGFTEEPEYEDDLEQSPVGEPTYRCNQCGAETPAEQGTAAGMCQQCGAPLSPGNYQEPPTAGVPKIKGTKRYPNGGVEFEVRNVFTTSAPFFAKDLKKAEWLKDEEDVTPSQVIEIFPDIDRAILEKSGQSDYSGYGTQVRQQISSQTGIRRHRENTVLLSKYWLRPSFMNNLREDKVDAGNDSLDGERQSLMDLLKNRFPRGLRVTMVNGEIMDLFEESIDDVWTACKPTVSKTLFCDPLCHDTVPVQELVNRTGNIAVATLLRALPVTFVESDLIDREMWKNREPISAEVLPVKLRTGKTVSDSMGQLPMAHFSDQMMPFMSGARAMSRENNGITESIFGGGPGLNTAREAEIRKQQALMQLRITYNNTRWSIAEARGKAVRQYARYAPGQMKAEPQPGILGPTAGQMIQIADLVDGKFHMEPDEAMARTFEDEREAFRELTSGNTAAPPELQAAVGLTSPVNLPRVQKFFGARGWYYPGKDEMLKLRKILQQLLATQPNPDGSPTVPLDPWDDPKIYASLMASWLNSDAGNSERDSNPQGFQNAVAFWDACNQAANPQQLPQPKMSVSLPLDKIDPNISQQVMGEFGLKVQPPPTPQPPPPPSAVSGNLPSAPGPGGQGLAVPEPGAPIPEPSSPIPGS